MALRVLITSLCVVAISFFSTAFAAAPDGTYDFVKAKGSLTIGGETIKLPQELVQGIPAISEGSAKVKKGKMKLDRNTAASIIKALGKELDTRFEISITGPKSLKLRKKGKIYKGSTTKPIVVRFSATVEGEELSGTISNDFDVKIKGKTLTMKVPLKGSLLGEKFSGKLVVKMKR
jgi:hypothetical protein